MVPANPRTSILLFPHGIRAGSPTKTRPLLPRSVAYFACGETGWPVVAPLGQRSITYPFTLCSNVAPRFTPRRSSVYAPFARRNCAGGGHRFHQSMCWFYPRFRLLPARGLRPTTLARLSPFSRMLRETGGLLALLGLVNFAVPVTAAPRRVP